MVVTLQRLQTGLPFLSSNFAAQQRLVTYPIRGAPQARCAAITAPIQFTTRLAYDSAAFKIAAQS